MLVLRCTRKLLDRLKVAPVAVEASSTTVLGDWYATYLPVRPAHLVLLVNERTRLPVVLPARELSTLPDRVPEAISRVLAELGVREAAIARERSAMEETRYDRTQSRSVLGTMSELAFHLELLRQSEPGLSEQAMSLRLGRGLVTVPHLGYQVPAELAAQILDAPRDSSPPRGAASRGEPAPKGVSSIYELRVTLRHLRPPIWRRLRVGSAVTLFQLHRILQPVMGWMDVHLHQFITGNTVYGTADPELPERVNEKTVRLDTLLRKPKDSLLYEYDFGDGWEHTVVLERVLEATPGGQYPHVVAGKRACPPEDCGGPGGYDRLLEAISDPKHPEHAELVEWMGDSFDPDRFDADEVNRLFHGGRTALPKADAPVTKSTQPRQTTLKPVSPRRRRR